MARYVTRAIKMRGGVMRAHMRYSESVRYAARALLRYALRYAIQRVTLFIMRAMLRAERSAVYTRRCHIVTTPIRIDDICTREWRYCRRYGYIYG